MIGERPAPALSRWIDPDLVTDRLQGRSREEVLRSLAETLEGRLKTGDGEAIFRSLRERERLGSTAVGRGFAIPHCRLQSIESPCVLVARSAEAIDFGAPDDVPVRHFFAVAAPASSTSLHLTILSAIARWLRDADRSLRLAGAAGRDGMLAVLQEGG
ncbi:MAG: PTS sugar transporter subunit IIA [Thermoanaerobaculia bacterium]